METYNEILKTIDNLPLTVKPIGSKSYDVKHSDGLTREHHEDIYPDPVPSIRKKIWEGNFTFNDKQQLNEFLVSKLIK
jgi:hypothetical protein